jgi:nucleoside-diphosphate-sugar epimerase
MVAMVGRERACGEIYNVTAEAVTTARYVQVLSEIVGVEPDVVLVPDAVLPEVTAPVFGHLFGVRHHAVLSTDKARHELGIEPRHDLRTGHEHTYEWFQRQGWSRRGAEPLVDPVWRASWDFGAEAELAGRLR